MTLRDIRVRKRIHELDRTKASYPTVARTGDKNRNGKFSLIFDDTRTVIFKANAAISYPTTFEVGDPKLSSDLVSNISIARTGTVNPSAVDPWLVRSYESEPYVGFVDSGRFTYDGTSDFYLTGTGFSDVGFGFSSGLKSKTTITIELPLDTDLPMLVNTASNYYYDDTTRQFSLVYSSAGGTRGVGTSPANTAGIIARIPLINGTIFNPIGTYTNDSTTSIVGSFFSKTVTLVKDIFFRNIGPSPITGSRSNPTSGQSLSMARFINSPFLLEKFIIEFPFAANSGWFQDRTRYCSVSDNSVELRAITDFGTPAINVGLLNYVGGNTKDVIAVGTVISEFDDVRALCKSVISHADPVSWPPGTHRSSEGYRSFSDPDYVVRRKSGDINYTGSIRMQMDVSSSSGIGTLWTPGVSGDGGDYFSSSLEGSSLWTQNVVGRSKVGGLDQITGRSIFGRCETPSLDSTKIVSRNRDLYIASGTVHDLVDWVYYSTDKRKKSPYLLYPTDKLVIALSKYRPAWVSTSFSSSPSGPLARYAQLLTTTNASLWHYPSSSHAPVIQSGTLKLTLFGSLIREGKEFHDTLNSRLDTAQIHEMIGSDPIVDQYDVFYSTELSGSTTDRFITGSIFIKTSLARQRVFSLSGIDDSSKIMVNGERGVPFDDISLSKMLTPRTEMTTNFRNIQCSSNDERFWDSMVPDIVDITRINNGVIQTNSSFASTQVSNEISLDAESSISDKSWTKSFPFEPKYSTVFRINQDKLRFKLSNDTVFRNVENQFTIGMYPGGVAGKNFSDTSAANFRDHKDSTGYSTLQTGLLATDLFKVYFGIGDLSTMVSSSQGYGYIGSTQFASFRVKAHDQTQNWDFLHKPLIRGWKYGLASGLPLFTKAVFVRNRYGFMRDMLEQRSDTKFAIQGSSIATLESAVKVRFVNSNGDSVSPEETFSSNLSLEVTSSLPYFDGAVRNREEPISFAKTNQSIVVI